jgi:cell division initiation protein
MGGFKKNDVNSYVDNLVNDFNTRLREKDIELSTIKSKLADLEIKHEDIAAKYEALEYDRQSIANALIQAQSKADRIVEDAQAKYKEELAEYDKMLNDEKEKIVEMKQQVRATRTLIVEILKNFEEQTGKIVQDDE